MRPHIVGENTESEAEVVTAVQGETVTLECNVTDAHPPADITWYRGKNDVWDRGLQY